MNKLQLYEFEFLDDMPYSESVRNAGAAASVLLDLIVRCILRLKEKIKGSKIQGSIINIKFS